MIFMRFYVVYHIYLHSVFLIRKLDCEHNVVQMRKMKSSTTTLYYVCVCVLIEFFFFGFGKMSATKFIFLLIFVLTGALKSMVTSHNPKKYL